MVVEDQENGFGVVRIIPSKELTLPVEVISIDPATVDLEKKTDPPDPNSLQESQGPDINGQGDPGKNNTEPTSN